MVDESSVPLVDENSVCLVDESSSTQIFATNGLVHKSQPKASVTLEQAMSCHEVFCRTEVNSRLVYNFSHCAVLLSFFAQNQY